VVPNCSNPTSFSVSSFKVNQNGDTLGFNSFETDFNVWTSTLGDVSGGIHLATGSGDGQAALIAMDSNGDTIAVRKYFVSAWDSYGVSVLRHPVNGFLIVGWIPRQDNYGEAYDMFFLKINDQYEKEWLKVDTTTTADIPDFSSVLPDSSILISNTSGVPGHFTLRRLDYHGNKLWESDNPGYHNICLEYGNSIYCWAQTFLSTDSAYLYTIGLHSGITLNIDTILNSSNRSLLLLEKEQTVLFFSLGLIIPICPERLGSHHLI